MEAQNTQRFCRVPQAMRCFMPRDRQPQAARHLLTSVYESEEVMLWILAMLLLALWAVGLVTSYTVGGFIHLLLVFALVAVLIRVIQGRRIT